MTRLYIWNIRAAQTDAQIAHLTAQADSDVLILTEYRQLVRGDRLSAALRQAGWGHQHTHVLAPKLRGVIIASRSKLVPCPLESTLALGSLAANLAPHVAVARLPEHHLTLVGVYMPYADGPLKETLWAALNHYARAHTKERLVIAGDFNSCVDGETEGRYLYTPRPLEVMRGATTDAWGVAAVARSIPDRDRFTWYSQGKYGTSGIRLDYAFLSPALTGALIDARHDHAVREQGLSDHSALIVDLEQMTSPSTL